MNRKNKELSEKEEINIDERKKETLKKNQRKYWIKESGETQIVTATLDKKKKKEWNKKKKCQITRKKSFKICKEKEEIYLFPDLISVLISALNEFLLLVNLMKLINMFLCNE